MDARGAPVDGAAERGVVVLLVQVIEADGVLPQGQYATAGDAVCQGQLPPIARYLDRSRGSVTLDLSRA